MIKLTKRFNKVFGPMDSGLDIGFPFLELHTHCGFPNVIGSFFMREWKTGRARRETGGKTPSHFLRNFCHFHPLCSVVRGNILVPHCISLSRNGLE